MTFVRSLCAPAALALLAALAAPPGVRAAAPEPAASQAQAAEPPPDQPPPAAPVFVRPLDEQGRAAPRVQPPPQTTGPTIDSVLSTMRKLGMITASAAVMLFGSALAGILIAGAVLLIRKRRERRTAS